MTAKPYNGRHYKVIQKDGLWYIKGPHAPRYPFFDLKMANRKARKLDYKDSQTRLRYSADKDS